MGSDREYIHIKETIEYDITLVAWHKRKRLRHRHLSASYTINNVTIQGIHMTITVPFVANTIPGQLVPLAIDGVTTEPITTITAGSEVYTSSDTTVATVAPNTAAGEGAFTVSRVAGASGTVVINYTATNTDGVTITNPTGDSFIFLGQPTGLAQSLSATYGTPS